MFFPKTTKLALAAAGAFLFLFCSVQGIDGRTYSLADVRGPKGTLVVFICNHCPYVKASIGRIVAEANALRQIGAIMPNDTEAYPEDAS